MNRTSPNLVKSSFPSYGRYYVNNLISYLLYVFVNLVSLYCKDSPTTNRQLFQKKFFFILLQFFSSQFGLALEKALPLHIRTKNVFMAETISKQISLTSSVIKEIVNDGNFNDGSRTFSEWITLVMDSSQIAHNIPLKQMFRTLHTHDIRW